MLPLTKREGAGSPSEPARFDPVPGTVVDGKYRVERTLGEGGMGLVVAATHLALAQRNSRLALYDLRETIESTRERIPVEFYAAVTVIGDTSCLEALAIAHTRAKDDWSRRQLADAFRAIVGREKLTRGHAVAKKIEKRWPGSWELLTQ